MHAGVPANWTSMTGKIDRVLARLRGLQRPDQLQSLVETVRDVYEIENVVYYSNDLAHNQIYGFTYSPNWVSHYQDAKLYNIDPVVQTAQKQFHPINWKSLDWSRRQSRQFFREAADCGVGNQGLTVPIRGPLGQFAVLTVNDATSDAKWKSFISEYTQDMLVLSHYIHKTIHDVAKCDEKDVGRELSPREKDVLVLLATGQSRAQLAERLGISEHTVRVYLDSARSKLGALNTTQAVAVAIQSGLVSI